MDVFAVRGYGLSNLRADTGLSFLYKKAYEFNGDFESLFSRLHSMSYWYDLENRLQNSVDNTNFYKNYRRDALYILWRYENHLRSQQGKQVEYLSWKQYLSPKNQASKLSIEHIAAQNHPMSKTDVEWVEGDIKKFSEVALNRLGNLVIDTISSNSSKGNKDFTNKIQSLSRDSTYLSQGELINWAENSNEEPIWTLQSVKKRHEHLKQFIFNTWSPDAYYRPVTPTITEEEEDPDLNQ